MTTQDTSTPLPPKPAGEHRSYKAFLDACARLRYVAIYPVCWGSDPAVYRTQLRGTQAAGYTCVHCDQLPGDTDTTGFIPVGYVVDDDGYTTLYQHQQCPV